jgi:hypothetical protein
MPGSSESILPDRRSPQAPYDEARQQPGHDQHEYRVVQVVGLRFLVWQGEDLQPEVVAHLLAEHPRIALLHLLPIVPYAILVERALPFVDHRDRRPVIFRDDRLDGQPVLSGRTDLLHHHAEPVAGMESDMIVQHQDVIACIAERRLYPGDQSARFGVVFYVLVNADGDVAVLIARLHGQGIHQARFIRGEYVRALDDAVAFHRHVAEVR